MEVQDVSFRTQVRVDTPMPIKLSPRDNVVRDTLEPSRSIDSSPINEFSIEEGFTIPSFDLEAIEQADPAIRKQMITAFGDAFKEYGFLAIKANKQDALLGGVYKVSSQYFGQDADIKEHDIHNNGGQTGYTAMGGESAAGSNQTEAKELWFIPPNFEKWPDSLPEFKDSIGDCHRVMWDYSQQTWSLLREYLIMKFNLDSEALPKTVEGPGNLLRLAHYLPGYPKSPWALPHVDLNLLTLLPRPSCAGLQMLYQGKMVPVTVRPGYFIVNGGDQLDRITAGYFKCTLHQVKNPGDGSERFAAIFFGSLDEEVPLDPLPVCLKDALKKKPEHEHAAFLRNYPACSVREARTARLIEIGMIKDPPREQFEQLWQQGLIQHPTEANRLKFPDLLDN